MPNIPNWFVVGILASVGLLAAACGVDDPAAGTAATPVPSDPLEAECFSTEAAPETIVAVIGVDTVPTWFDGINVGSCEFNGELTKIRVTLAGDGGSQTAVFAFSPPVSQIVLPLGDAPQGAVIDESFTPGVYERTVVAVAADGRTVPVQGFEPVLLVHTPESVQAQLQRAESRWQQSGITDYVYQMHWECFCLPEYLAPVIIKALFMTVWRPSTRSAEHSCGIRQG